jgi:hypothetical protein
LRFRCACLTLFLVEAPECTLRLGVLPAAEVFFVAVDLLAEVDLVAELLVVFVGLAVERVAVCPGTRVGLFDAWLRLAARSAARDCGLPVGLRRPTSKSAKITEAPPKFDSICKRT